MLQENFTSNEPFAQSVGYSPSVFLALSPVSFMSLLSPEAAEI